MTRPARSFLSKLTLFAVALLFSAGLLEVAARLLPSRSCFSRFPAVYQFDPVLGYRYRPGAEGRLSRGCEIDNLVRINGLGFHDRERDFAAQAAGLRILALGDSHTAGLQLPVSQGWTQRLENRYPEGALEVINLAIDGTGSDIHLELAREHAATLAPDLIVLAFGSNDVDDIGWRRLHRDLVGDRVIVFEDAEQRAAIERFMAEQAPGKLLASLGNYSAFLRLAGRSFPRLYLLQSNFVSPSRIGLDTSRTPRTAGSRLGFLITELARLAEAHGAGFAIVPVPYRSDASASYERLRQHLPEALFERLDIRDPIPEMNARLARDGKRYADLYWETDGHFNAYGHEVYAAAVAALSVDHAVERSRKRSGARGEGTARKLGDGNQPLGDVFGAPSPSR